MPVNGCYFLICRRLKAVKSLLAKIFVTKKPANWKHLSHLSLELRSWRPLKEGRSPSQGKCWKSASESAGPKRGCRGKCQKSALHGSRLLYYLYIGAGPGALFSALSSAPRFGPALSEALFRHFSWPGLRHFFIQGEKIIYAPPPPTARQEFYTPPLLYTLHP